MSRVLVVANETVEAEELLAELRRIEDERTSTFLVVAPAVAPDHGLAATWSQAGAIDAAQERLDRTLAVLRDEGLDCDGWVGDMLPVAAVRDALDRFDADLIVISTHPPTRSHWLRKDVVEQVRRRFGKPVVHVVSHVRERDALR
jgi:GABA permease